MARGSRSFAALHYTHHNPLERVPSSVHCRGIVTVEGGIDGGGQVGEDGACCQLHRLSLEAVEESWIERA